MAAKGSPATTRPRVLPDSTPENHLAHLVAPVHHRLQQSVDRALHTVGITPTQFYALAHIAQSPGLSSADQAHGLLTTPQAVATLVRRLNAAGLIEQDQPGRGLTGAVRLTAAGRRKSTAPSESPWLQRPPRWARSPPRTESTSG